MEKKETKWTLHMLGERKILLSRFLLKYNLCVKKLNIIYNYIHLNNFKLVLIDHLNF